MKGKYDTISIDRLKLGFTCKEQYDGIYYTVAEY